MPRTGFFGIQPAGSELCAFGIALLLPALLVCTGSAGSAPASKSPAGLVTAPDEIPAQRVLVDVSLNGVGRGQHLVEVANDHVGLAPAELASLHIAPVGSGPLWLTPSGTIKYELDIATASLKLHVPPALMSLQRFAPDEPATATRLSPETWGMYANYDVNVRRSFGGRAGSDAAAGFGGIADLRVLAPDVVGSFGWAYDSGQPGPNRLVRLDSTLTWRPAAQSIAVSLGDALPLGEPMGVTRPYRFFGLQLGTDFSGTPGWSAAPIASINGSAQAQSVLDLYLNGQRAYSTVTAGGPFSLTLPAGVTAGGASLLLTDVTGRSVLVPVELPRVDAQLLRPGTFLWSAGAGAPRFGYGTARTTYAPQLYGYASARYGASERMTLRSHLEVGPSLVEAELGADTIVTPFVALRGSVAASRSGRGVGGAGRVGLAIAGPWGLNFDATLARTFGRFDDVVSVSGRDRAERLNRSAILTLPTEAELSARLSWQVTQRLSVSSSYQANRFPSTGTAGIAALSANYLAGSLPLFANAFQTFGRRQTTSILAGISFQFGAVQGAASFGTSIGDGGASGFGHNLTGSVNVSQPMHDELGSIGWNAYATGSPSGTFVNADAQTRTGYGIPGIALQSFGRVTTGYATMRGSAGIVAGHPFVSDPVQGGLIVVDADRSGVPVQLNGFDRGKTSFDGKLAISGAVPGIPQRVGIDTSGLPFDAVPTVTDGEVTMRPGGATMIPFRVESSAGSARFQITLHGEPPPVGSTVTGSASSAPVGKDGQAYLPAIAPGEVLRVEMPDGRTCQVRTGFDGRGGLGRRLGKLPCDEARG